jgi:hypothetical protein
MELAPSVQYANAGGLQIAYQVLGDGPRDLMFHLGYPSHLELQ